MRLLIITIAIALLIGCAHAPTLQSVHDEVMSKYTPVSGMSVAQWDGDYFWGNCAVFAREVLIRADEQGVDAEYIVVWRNEGDVLTGYVMKWHAAVISGNQVSNSNNKWVIPEREFWERWTK